MACAVSGCDRDANGHRGWCLMHYTRWWRHGDPLIVKKPSKPSAVERFWACVQIGGTDECWPWTGVRDANNYGYFTPANGKRMRATRFSVALHSGPFDQRLHILHSCDNPACVNPAHLRLGTHAENMAEMAVRGRTPNSRKTHCPQGHPYDETNTYRWGGYRYCRACNNAIRRASSCNALAVTS